MKQFYNLKSKTSVLAALAFGMLGTSAFGQLYPFTDHTFTNASATGQDGPTLAACQTAYTAEVWELNPAWFSMDTQGIQKWTVPATGDYELEVAGAKGGDDTWASETGGLGTTMTGTFALTEGDILYIMVGQAGENTRVAVDNAAPGGGGGTFVWDPSDLSAPLIAGGGGGGANGHAYAGRQSTDGMDGNDSYSVSNGGIGGNGGRSNAGGSSYWAGGGAGWLTDGTAGNNSTNYDFDGAGGYGKADGGRKPLNGGQGGKRYNDGSDEGGDGGFGGGGGGGSDNMGTGGGGGYSGGGGERGFQYAGGGGGSFNAGTDQVNVAANNEDHGYVTITLLCNPLTISIPVTGVCIGSSLVISASSTTGGTVTWDSGVVDGDPFFPTLGTTTITSSSTSPDDCAFSVDISASEIPTITAESSVPAACEGALITLWGEGGDTYTWTGDGDITPIDSVSFLAEDGTTTYTLVGSVLGCEGPAVELVLVGAPQPDVSAISTPIELCYGNSYVLTGDGAAAYDWGGSIEDGDEIFSETPGTFIHTVVGVSGDGCYDTAMVTVNVYEVPVVNGGLDVTVCEGDEVTLTGSGADSYIWTPSATDGVPFTVDAGTTTYTVTGSNEHGCEDTDEVIVMGVELPQVTSSVITPEAFGFDGEIDITVGGGSGTYLYSWAHGPTTEDVDGLNAGTYTVTIDDATIHPGMCPTTESFTMTSIVGIEDESIVNFTAYPNPTTDELTITYNGQFNYKVTTLLGQVVMNGSSTDTENISLKSFANGTYIVEVTANDVVNTIQIVKQ